ncbi:MAG: helix-turn-helix domain-containing protein [Betaproteobacteria bacterium]|nr:helix-turn-helix domain-containing protein [Betaproteobacteria bacterium]
MLQVIGHQVRWWRQQRKWTRKELAQAAHVSERHLASLESGTGNASIMILLQVSQALDCEITDLLSSFNLKQPQLQAIQQLLIDKTDTELKVVHGYLSQLLSAKAKLNQRKIALVGLRGAGKTTIGQRLANELQLHFVELSRDIEKLAGCKTNEIHSLYGPLAYQRYQLRALENALASELPAIIATTGGIVMDMQAWEKLQGQCLTIWLQAKPEDHLNRVMAQGDMRPMAGSSQALEDLKHILDERTPIYSQAHQSVDTSAMNLKETVKRLTHDLKYAMKLA